MPEQPVTFAIADTHVTITVDDARLLVRSLGQHGADGTSYLYETTAGRVETAIGSGETVRLDSREDALALLRVLDHLRNESEDRLRYAPPVWQLRDLIIRGFAIEPLAYIVVAKGGIIRPQRFVSHSGDYVPRDLLVTGSGDQWRVVTVEGETDDVQALFCHAEP